MTGTEIDEFDEAMERKQWRKDFESQSKTFVVHGIMYLYERCLSHSRVMTC